MINRPTENTSLGLFALIIMACIILLLVIFLAITESKKEKAENTIPVTLDQVMVIYETGYLHGAQGVMRSGTFEDIRWKVDSAKFRMFWSDVFNENKEIR